MTLSREKYERSLARRREAFRIREAAYRNFVARCYGTGEKTKKAVYGYLKARFEFLKKFNFTCQYCGRRAPEVSFHIDHIFPRSKGGSNDISNLTLACTECNVGKGNRLL